MRGRGVSIRTFTGRDVYPLAPDPDAIAIEDIAHHLALQNRFAGATVEPYSVAQHSVLVSYCCDPADALHGLLHDAAEAYLGDLVRPLKRLGLLGGYRAIEAQLQVVIYGRFGLAPETPASVKVMDARLGVTEAQLLFRSDAVPVWARQAERLPMAGLPIEPWSACCAEQQFLDRFRGLMQVAA
ncbi:MAG: hypothetical protein A3J29_07940 [Acidobacteria bacterium RIFCSPLOWO2_12_FULL_67_14b]|nr:MAG: hypothetical protein A3J29_07940 [Acidobacteria bacterium RIFCSPLOWO2_12_FULL_67_14b]